MNLKTFWSILIFCGIFSTAAGQSNLDSLWGVWENTDLKDTSRLNALYIYAKDGVLDNEPDSAFMLGKMMVETATAKQLAAYVANAKHLQGLARARTGKLDEALNLYNECLAVRKSVDDKEGITAVLDNIGIVYKKQGDFDKALEILFNNLKLKEELGDEFSMSTSFNNIGNLYLKKGDHELALEYFNKSLELDRKYGDKSGVGSVLSNIGIVYYHEGNLALAIDKWTQSLQIKEEAGDMIGAANTLNNIGVVHDNQGDYEKALEYHSRALGIRRNIKDKRGIASSLHNMGVIYNLQNKTDLSLEVNRESLRLREEMGNRSGIAHSYNNIGEAYRISENYVEAIAAHEKSLAIREEIGDKRSGSSLINLGLTYMDMGDYANAIKYSSRGLTKAKEVEMVVDQRDAYLQLFEAYKALDEAEKALINYEAHISMRDSIESEENQREVLRHEFKYQYEKEAITDSLEFVKREAVMEERSEKQKLGLVASGGGLLLVLMLAFSIYNGKKKSDELLLNILPYETAQELKKTGQSEAKLIEEVTVLFTDFKGFTALSEQLSPKDLVQDLNVCFSEFDRIIEKYGIEKIKTIGDAYMAAGGVPTPTKDHARNVINAALEMRDFVEEGKARKIKQGLPYFEIRIGVHTGPVVAGIVGIKKFQYDIWGDTVNTASRMESSGEAGKVNVSESTYSLVQDDFYFKYRGEIEAKGKGKLKMYFVEGNGPDLT